MESDELLMTSLNYDPPKRKEVQLDIWSVEENFSARGSLRVGGCGGRGWAGLSMESLRLGTMSSVNRPDLALCITGEITTSASIA